MWKRLIIQNSNLTCKHEAGKWNLQVPIKEFGWGKRFFRRIPSPSDQLKADFQSVEFCTHGWNFSLPCELLGGGTDVINSLQDKHKFHTRAKIHWLELSLTNGLTRMFLTPDWKAIMGCFISPSFKNAKTSTIIPQWCFIANSSLTLLLKFNCIFMYN